MRSARFWLLLFPLCLSIFFISSPSLARADALVITPSFGNPGVAFVIQGAGFDGGEAVAFYARYPDNRIVQLGTVNAGGDGSVSFTLQTDASFPYGAYIVLAHGTGSGHDVYGLFNIGTPASGTLVSGSGSCQGNNFVLPGFAPGETVILSVRLPDGSVQSLGTGNADGSGNVTFPLSIQPGMAPGTYTILAQGLVSGHQTSDGLSFDGITISGAGCSVSGGSAGGYVPGLIPNNIVNYQGPGVYLNTNPAQLYYFDCNWKWRPMGGIVYMLILGFRPFETVNVAYEILAQQGRTPYGTITADSYGNAAFAVNTATMPNGHYHWWFTSSSASYCGHYDLAH